MVSDLCLQRIIFPMFLLGCFLSNGFDPSSGLLETPSHPIPSHSCCDFLISTLGKEGYHYLLELQIISGQIRSGHDIPVCGSDLVGGHIQCCPRSLISAKSAETRYRRRGCVLACTIHNFAASTVEGTSSDSQANTRNLAHGWELQEGRKGHYQ